MSDTARRPQSRQADDGDFWPSDAGGPDATSPGRGSRRGGGGGDDGGAGRRGRSGRGGRKLYFVAAAAVVAIAAVVAVVVVVTGGGSKKGGEAAAVGSVTLAPPTIFDSQPVSSNTAKLNDRAKSDPRALNPGEVFTTAAQKVSGAGFTFTMVAKDLSSNCASVAWGSQLLADLQQYGCTQISRIAYLSTDGQYSGQAIAINLASLAGSQQILRDLTPAPGSGFIKPLPGAGIKNFGGGFSAAYPSPFGHYVLIPWVQLNGGAQPKSLANLISASVAVGYGNDFSVQRLIDAR